MGKLNTSPQTPFEAIANKKGKKITFLDESNKSPRADISKMPTLHLDMDMVDASLEDAKKYAIAQNKNSLVAKLEKLQLNGSDSDKVYFVHGTGTYFFSEDIAIMAEDSRKGGVVERVSICDNLCYIVCRCLIDGDQICSRICRQICSIS